MKTSDKFASALLALAMVTLFGVGFVSPVGKVMAEGVVEAVQAVAVQTIAIQGDRPRQCEEREVEADEGYGVSRKEVRLFCR
ncbi:hypothetical protein [uncultured Rhodoblastus sp.]|uniref:hypothetical protein n=1 Tax=uncultured Rhodoblastus sp. TaxID=543037 RepID=UPI0025FA1BFF|nr:hypothetical protein [uncultured Rhodoblastus sp.]